MSDAPTLAQALAAISGQTREQLSHLTITGPPPHVTCHTHEPTPGPSGPLAATPDMTEQIAQLDQLGIVGKLTTKTTGTTTRVTLWSEDRDAWQTRMDALRAHPHAGADLLERAGRIKTERARWQAAVQAASTRAGQARTSGLAEDTIELFLQETTQIPSNPTPRTPAASEAPAAEQHGKPSTRPGFVRMPVGHSSPCVICQTPATHTFNGQPLHQGECANRYTDHEPTDPGATPPTRPETHPAPATTPPTPQPPEAPRTTRKRSTRTTKTKTPDRTRFAAAVTAWDGHTLYLPGGKTHPLPHVQHLGELAELVGTHRLGHGGGAARPDRGEVLIYPPALPHLDLPEEVDRAGHGSREARARAREQIFAEFTSRGVVQDALAEGWQIANDRLDVRTLLTHPDRLTQGAQLTVLSWFDWQGNPLFAADTREDGRDVLADPQVVVDRLQEFADLTGITWRVSGGQTGVDLIDVKSPPTSPTKDPVPGRLQSGQRPELPMFLTPKQRREDKRFTGAAEEVFSWYRPWSTLLEEEKAQPHVIAYDHGANFRGPFTSTEIGVRGLEILEGEDARWDGTEKPGYWAISGWESPMWNLPDPGTAGGLHIENGIRIVTAHTLQQLKILDEEAPWALTYHRAWVWRDHTRLLRGVGEALTHTASEGSPEVAAACKEVYSQMVQKVASVNYPPTQQHLRQPPIRDFIVGAARTSILRTLTDVFQATGRSPLAVSRDTIFYAADTNDPRAAWPGKPEKYGTGGGQWKPTGIASLVTWGPACLPDPRPNAGTTFDYGHAMNHMTTLDPATGEPTFGGDDP